MQTPANCTPAKQHGPTGSTKQLALHPCTVPSPISPSHTSRALLGLALTWSQAGHSVGSTASLTPLFSTVPGCALPQTPLQHPRLSNRERSGARFKGTQLKSWDKCIHRRLLIVSRKCSKLSTSIYVKNIDQLSGVFNQTIRALGRSKCILPHFLIQLLIFVTRH